MTLKILKFPNTWLTMETFDVDTELLGDGAFLTLVSEVQRTLANTPGGAALASNQVGISQRFFVLEPELASSSGLPQVILNPIITYKSGMKDVLNEGCLSFPGVLLPLERSTGIDVEFQGLDGIKQNKSVVGFAARVFQHEVEHLDGKVYTSNLNRIQRFQIEGLMRKRK